MVSEISASPVAEGVRFTLGSATAFAVRQDNKDIALRIRRGGASARQTLTRIPFVRGIARFLFGIADLIGGMSESADLDPQRIHRGSYAEGRLAKRMKVHPESLVAFGSGLLIFVILAALLFALPFGVQALLTRYAPTLSRTAENAIMCLTHIAGLLSAFLIIPRLRVVRRLSMYQGAINKVVNTYCAGGGHVTLDDAMRAEAIAPRCDTAFIALVLCLSVVAFALVRTYTLPVQLLVRILLMFAVAAVVNEPIAALENAELRGSSAALLAPMLVLQRLFTAEPHAQMVEVAVFAFNAARENDI